MSEELDKIEGLATNPDQSSGNDLGTTSLACVRPSEHMKIMEELKKLEKLKKSLETEEAKGKFSELMMGKDANGIGRILLNLDKIDEPDEFLSLTHKYETRLEFHSDSIEFDRAVRVPPKLYNTIGKNAQKAAMFTALSTGGREKWTAAIEKVISDCYDERPPGKVKDYEKAVEDFKSKEGNMDAEGYKSELATREKDLKLAKLWASTKEVLSTGREKWTAAVEKVISDCYGEQPPGKVADYERAVKDSEEAVNDLESRRQEMNAEKYESELAAHKSKLVTYEKDLKLAKLWASVKCMPADVREGTQVNALIANMEACAHYRRELFFATAHNYKDVETYNARGNEFERQFLHEDETLPSLRNKVAGGTVSADEQRRCEKAEAARRLRMYNDARANSFNPKSVAKKHYFKNGKDNSDRETVGGDVALKEFEKAVEKHQKYVESTKTFTGGSYERLHYEFNTRRVVTLIQQYLESSSDATSARIKKIVIANTDVSECDRLNRVVVESNPSQIREALKLCTDLRLESFVNRPSDVAAMIEFVKLKKSAQEIVDQMRKIRTMKLPYNHEWNRDLSTAYHHPKHENNWGKNATTFEQYFNERAEDIFKGKNRFEDAKNIFRDENRFEGKLFDLSGNVRNVYCQAYGEDRHIGFSRGTPPRGEIMSSHYIK